MIPTSSFFDNPIKDISSTEDPKVSTGTTSLLLRYDKGYLLASDRRASVGLSYAFNDAKVRLAKKDENEKPQIAYTGAGLARCIEVAGKTIFGKYLRNYESYVGQRLSQLTTINDVKAYLLDYNDYLVESHRYSYNTYLDVSFSMIVGLARFDHGRQSLPFAFAWGHVIFADQWDRVKMNPYIKKGSIPFIAFGSGGAYLYSLLESAEMEKSFTERSFEQSIEIIKKGFKVATAKDLVSFPQKTDAGEYFIDLIYLDDGAAFVAEKLFLSSE